MQSFRLAGTMSDNVNQKEIDDFAHYFYCFYHYVYKNALNLLLIVEVVWLTISHTWETLYRIGDPEIK